VKTARTLLIAIAGCAVLVIGGCALLPTALHALNPGVMYRVPDAGRTLYLTLDDGPSDATGIILGVLRKHQTPATFFITTDHIRADRMAQILTDGHQLANHLKTTTNLSRLSDAQFEADFKAADQALAPFPHAKLFRPPGGSISAERVRYVADQGYAVVVGTVFPLDHWLESKASIETLAKALTIDGGIVILHDTAARGARTAEVLDDLIPQLQARGYRFALLPAATPPGPAPLPTSVP
jgi:peptidoglycan/xylan/chitin deacetylase (PgdA/CDA1 family)